MGKLGFLFNPEGNMPKGEIKSRDVEFDFLGLLTESVDGNDNKSNGAIKLDEDSIYIELRSRLNGKVKDAFEIAYDDLNAEDIDRVADNKVIADVPAEIRKYHDLLKDGIITAEEFEKKKKELLNN